MPNYFIQPINMISTPNYYAELTEGKGFDIVDNNATTIWFILKVQDELGIRRFIPASGSTLQIEFPRINQYAVTTTISQPVKTPQSITKNGTQDASDKSLYNIALSATEAGTVRAGTVKVILTQGANVTSWVENYIIKKTLTKPGC